jgi:hypothetical protein
MLLVHTHAAGLTTHDDPDTATVIPAACAVSYTDTIPGGTLYQTANVLEACGANSVGGVYYSIGPVALPGLLELPLNQPTNNSYGIGIMVAMYGSSSSSGGPSCITATYPDANRAALMSYEVTADDVASNRTFLVRVGVVDDGSGDAFFREAFHLTVRFHCYIPSPNDDSSHPLAVALANTCSDYSNQTYTTIPAYATYQLETVLGHCGPSIGGVYYTIGPFPSTGFLEVLPNGPCTCNDQWCNCEWPDSQTTVALFDQSSHACIPPSMGRVSFNGLLYQVTQDDVSSARTFLVKVGTWADMWHGEPWHGSTEVFLQELNIQFKLSCAVPSINDSPDTALVLDTSDICSRQYVAQFINRGTTYVPRSGTAYEPVWQQWFDMPGCGGSEGGVYYSIGPFLTTGSLAASTEAWGCYPVGAQMVLALYDSSSPNTCIAFSALSYAGTVCASLTYQVTAADVEGNRTFLVRASLLGDGNLYGGDGYGSPMFRDSTELRISLSDCSPVVASPDASSSPAPQGNLLPPSDSLHNALMATQTQTELAA